MIELDFETRSMLSIKKVNAYRYAEHWSTEVLCLSYTRVSGNIFSWKKGLDTKILQPLFQLISAGIPIEAHNIEFEYAIWNTTLYRQIGPIPKLEINQLRCSAAKCAIHALPRSLDGAGEVLKIKEKKDLEGYRLMLKMCKPRRPNKYERALE